MKVDDNLFPKVIFSEVAAPGTPAANTVVFYVKTDGSLYSKNDAGTETLITPSSGTTQTIVSAATVTPLVSDIAIEISAQNAAITFNAPTGTAALGQGFLIALKDDGTPRGITWNAVYVGVDAALVATTTAGKWMYFPVVRNGAASVWHVFKPAVQL